MGHLPQLDGDAQALLPQDQHVPFPVWSLPAASRSPAECSIPLLTWGVLGWVIRNPTNPFPTPLKGRCDAGGQPLDDSVIAEGYATCPACEGVTS